MTLHFRRSLPHFAVLALSGALAACGSDYTPPVVKSATLSPLQEVAEVGSLAKGTGSLTLEPDSNNIVGSITLTGLTATAAHIHAGAAGVNGDVIVPMVQDSANPGVWNVPPGARLSAAQVEAFRAGALYFNAHSAKYPGGEVRGQIGREVAIARLSGAQESPQNASAATGLGVISVDPETKRADLTLSYANITPTAAHVHSGAIAANGPVTIPLGDPAANKYTANAVQLTDVQLAEFRAKALYFNLHTTQFPGGEIRGQIGYQVRIGAMSGAQENPPVAGSASGVGFLAYDADTRTGYGRFTVQGMAANAGHVHRGAAGANGPVNLPFQQAGADGLTWASNGWVAVSDADAGLLFNEGLYLNAHSLAFPGGHVRGQLIGNK